MTQSMIIDAYFEWMCDHICRDRFARGLSFRKLLAFLHRTEFIFSIPKDANRAEDGLNLRYRFGYDTGYDDTRITGPCSVFEMMLALAIRCEEDIMDNGDIGDRTGQWFWGMVVNLGLGGMDDTRFDELYATEVITRFLNREYAPDGRGGLFTIKRCVDDLRDVEIWYQMNWYLNSIT